MISRANITYHLANVTLCLVRPKLAALKDFAGRLMQAYPQSQEPLPELHKIRASARVWRCEGK